MKTNHAKPLYLSTPVRRALPDAIRPGDFFLTHRLSELVELNGKTVIDAGCGTGASLRFLRGKKTKLLIGIDPAITLFDKKDREIFLGGKMEALPLSPNCADLILAECSWNLSDRRASLQEFHRVLKQGGQLFLSDIFSRSGKISNWPVSCCFSAATSLEKICQLVVEAGFLVQKVEDHTPLLKKKAAEFIFHYGSLEEFWQQVTGTKELARKACRAGRNILPGLFFLLAKKHREQTMWGYDKK